MLSFLAVAGTELSPSVLSPLINLGAMGVVLIWFMFRAEPRMRGMERAIDRQTRATILLAASLPNQSQHISDLGQDIIRETEESNSK